MNNRPVQVSFRIFPVPIHWHSRGAILLGVLLSLGSSSAVSNVVAGIALTYTRSFNIGDRVKIGEHSGDIIEKFLLATRIRTVKTSWECAG